MARRAGRLIGSLLAVLVLGAGGYAAADAYDVVPGRLTLDPVPPTQAPFPTAPGAVPPPAAEVAVGHLDPDAPMPTPEAVTALADSLGADPRMGLSVGVVVTDVLTGQVLADVDGATPRTPASTAKILTAFAASTALGAERTLTTEVVQGEPGSIVLVGHGDMLLAPDAGDPDAVNGRAGLGDLARDTARALQAAGTTQVNLYLDDTVFAGPGWNPGWHPSHIQYVAPTAALAVNGGKTRDVEFAPRYLDPAIEAAKSFAALLTAQGITVTGPVRATAPAGATQLAAVESAPMRELIAHTIQWSDNTEADVLGRLVAIERGAPATISGATDSVVAEAGSLVDVSGVVLADCSGLADGTRVPARVLTELLVLASTPGHTDLLPTVVDLPVSGWEGTLGDRYLEGPARGLVRAKTGSLPGVTSLAGTVLTTQGRLVAFAVVADRTPAGGQDAPRAAIDAFVAQLAVQPPVAAG